MCACVCASCVTHEESGQPWREARVFVPAQVLSKTHPVLSLSFLSIRSDSAVETQRHRKSAGVVHIGQEREREKKRKGCQRARPLLFESLSPLVVCVSATHTHTHTHTLIHIHIHTHPLRHSPSTIESKVFSPSLSSFLLSSFSSLSLSLIPSPLRTFCGRLWSVMPILCASLCARASRRPP